VVKRKQIEVVRNLKELLNGNGIRPDKIIIFGSQIRPGAAKDSDIDIIVLSEDFEGKGIFERVKMSSGVHNKLVQKLFIPVDLMYYSLSEWKKGASLIIEAAKKEGVTFS